MDVLHPLGRWDRPIEIQFESLISSTLLAAVFLVYIHLSKDLKWACLTTVEPLLRRNKDGGFQFEIADIRNVIVRNWNAFSSDE